MSGTDITYNSITFRDVLTRGINQEPVFDSTGVNLIYTKVTIEADVTIIANQSNPSLGYSNNQSLGEAVKNAQAKILVPRRQFIMSVDNVEIFRVSPSAVEKGVSQSGGKAGRTLANVDINHGPKASLDIRQIISNKVARATFRIEMAVPDCHQTTEGATGGLVSLRFWTTDDVDENWYTTRTSHGRLRVQSRDYSPHSFRNVIFPPLTSGFKRENISMVEDPNGLELEFTVVDKEFYTSCPGPATTWKGTHNVSTPFVGGIIGDSEVRVELEAPRNVGKTELIQLAVKIIDAKLQLSTADLASVESEGRAILQYYAISEDLGRNRITATARVRHTTGTSTSQGNIFSQTVGQPLVFDDHDYDHNRPSYNGPPTASLAGILLQKLTTSCDPLSKAAVSTTGLLPGESAKETGKPTFDLKTGSLSDYSNSLSEDQGTASYTAYMLSSEVDAPQGVVGLPVGSAGGDSDVSQVFVQLHKPIATMTVRVIAERAVVAPKIPKPKSSYVDPQTRIRHTLLNWNVNSAAVALTGDSRSPLYHVEASIVYGLSRAPDLSKDKLEIGRNPAIAEGKVITSLPATMFTDELYKTGTK